MLTPKLDPYAFARISAMKSKLLPTDVYKKLLKMEIHEILRYLEETDYKQEIDLFALENEGVDLMELAGAENLAKTYMKLLKITTDDLKKIIQKYLERNDIENIKTVIRAQYAGIDNVHFIPTARYSKKFLMILMEKPLHEILKLIPADLSEGISYFEKTNSLVVLENQIDKYYFESLLEMTESLPDEMKAFIDFVKSDIAILNLKNIIKLKNAHFEGEGIMEFLIKPDKYMESLAFKESILDVMEQLKNGEFGECMDTDLISMEFKLDRELLKKADILQHAEALSVDVILGYLFAKETEVRNLNRIIKAKHLRMPENFIEKVVVY